MFTGEKPAGNGQMDNSWTSGQATIDRPTIFSKAKSRGFQTAYFYSKQKLGYLVNNAVDVHQWSRENAVDMAEAFLETAGRHFVFLHVSGLDEVGPQYGWLSTEYLEELTLIDDYLSMVIGTMKRQKNYLIIVTSDHAGHDRIHGSRHPQDYRMPLIISSDTVPVKQFQDISYSVIDLKKILEKLL